MSRVIALKNSEKSNSVYLNKTLARKASFSTDLNLEGITGPIGKAGLDGLTGSTGTIGVAGKVFLLHQILLVLQDTMEFGEVQVVMDHTIMASQDLVEVLVVQDIQD
jgi:hypothetical protein